MLEPVLTEWPKGMRRLRVGTCTLVAWVDGDIVVILNPYVYLPWAIPVINQHLPETAPKVVPCSPCRWSTGEPTSLGNYINHHGKICKGPHPYYTKTYLNHPWLGELRALEFA